MRNYDRVTMGNSFAVDSRYKKYRTVRLKDTGERSKAKSRLVDSPQLMLSLVPAKDPAAKKGRGFQTSQKNKVQLANCHQR